MRLKIREIHKIKDPQIFSADNYSRIATIQRWKTIRRWQLFKNGNYSRVETIQEWQLLKD